MSQEYEKISRWVIKNPPLTSHQTTALSVGAVFCLLSVVVCAPMGGAGGQSLFRTQSPWAYWPFFFLSPILILFLCGRAMYRIVKSLTEPIDPDFEELCKKPSVPIEILRYCSFGLLGIIASAFNAYNTLQYVEPSWLAKICFIPSFIIPAFPMVPAFIEYHRRLWAALLWVVHGKSWRERQSLLPESRLGKSERQYRQLSVNERREADAVFSHLYFLKKLDALFDPSILLKKPPKNFSKPKLVYVFGVLGFLIGTVAELYSYRMGRKIAAPIMGEMISQLFGIVEAYVRMGISGVATMDVFSEIVDDSYHFYKTRKHSVTTTQGVMRFGLFLLALTSSLPVVRNQIATIGQTGFFGHILSLCAIIAPACIFFWAGDLVFRDYQYARSGMLSYRKCHDRFFSNLGAFKEEYYQTISRSVVSFQ